MNPKCQILLHDGQYAEEKICHLLHWRIAKLPQTFPDWYAGLRAGPSVWIKWIISAKTFVIAMILPSSKYQQLSQLNACAEILTLNLFYMLMQNQAKKKRAQRIPLLYSFRWTDCCNEGGMEKNSTTLPNYSCLERNGDIDVRNVGKKQSWKH